MSTRKAAILFSIILSTLAGATIIYPAVKYGTSCTIYFSLYDSNSPWQFFETKPAVDDVYISKDGGTPARATNPVTDLNHIMSLVLTDAEMTAKVTVVDINDETSPAAYGSETIIVPTYGYAGFVTFVDANDGVNVDEVRLTPPLRSSGEADMGRLIMLKLGAVDDDPNVGSVSYNVKTFLLGDAYGRLGPPAGASVSADIAAINLTVDDVLDAPITGTTMTLEESLAYITDKVKSLWKVGR